MATWIEEEGEIPEEYIGKEVQDMEQVYEEPQWQSRSGEIPTDYLGQEEQQYAETTTGEADESLLKGKIIGTTSYGSDVKATYYSDPGSFGGRTKDRPYYGIERGGISVSSYANNPYAAAMANMLIKAGYKEEALSGRRLFLPPPATTKTWSEYRSFYEDPETGNVTYGNWTTDQSKLGLSGDWKESVLVPTRTENWKEYRSYYEDPETNEKIYGDWTKDEEATGGLTGTWRRFSDTPNAEAVQKAQYIQQKQKEMMSACSSYRGAQYTACVKAVNEKILQFSGKAMSGFARGGLVEPKETKGNTMMNRNMYPQGYADGGNVMPMPSEEEMMGLMEPSMPPMEETEVEAYGAIDKIMSVLNEEEMMVLNDALEMHPELITILDKVDVAFGGEFDGEGAVSGPGTETSDSIPAKLSDGEFVFTAKAVKQLGVDKLRKMMDKAEREYDSSMSRQEELQLAMGEGYALGGLLSAAASEQQKMRKQAADYAGATSEYQQPAMLQKPERVDGMGRQVPQGQTGILGQREIDLRQQERSIRPRMEQNMNQQSMGQASTTAAAAQTPRASLESEAGRMDMQQRLQQNAEEEQQPSLMMV
jgi:hypothetical protein